MVLIDPQALWTVDPDEAPERAKELVKSGGAEKLADAIDLRSLLADSPGSAAPSAARWRC